MFEDPGPGVQHGVDDNKKVHTMTTALIAIDNCPESDDVMASAQCLLEPDTRFIVVSVVSPVYVSPIAPETMMVMPDASALRQEAQQMVQEAGSHLDETPTTEALVGDPVDAICASAREHAVDVIVIGSHDRGWFSRALDPPLRDRLVREAPCPVLVVRHSRDEAHSADSALPAPAAISR
jgi:nucleotide-binding universal stress UspA family protein